MNPVTLLGIAQIPEIQPGDDLGRLIVTAATHQGIPLSDGDILVVTQKAVSKAEGRMVCLSSIEPSAFAKELAKEYNKDARLLEVILRESRRIVRMDKGIIITETKHGFICANAGVDKSNVPGDTTVTLLPSDPDLSAQRIRATIYEMTKLHVPVLISDTFGRPWREGVVNFAIGISGLEPIVDYRGTLDPHGNLLKVTQVAVADEIVAAADLVMGKINKIPAAIVRGCSYLPEAGSCSELIRSADHDLFR